MMRALTVQPGVPGSLQLEEFKVPPAERGAVLVRAMALGICGTDRDIVAGNYGSPPPGHQRLILGHESLGRIEEAPKESGFSHGDLVVCIVRHPDPVPCENCAVGEWDMCRNGRFTEHGIKSLDGFGSEFYRIDPEFVVPVDESLGLFAVLVEPASIVAKAWQQIERIGVRATWTPKTLLVTGAGPVGLLAAMFGAQRGLDVHVYDHNETGPKPALVRALGASYHSTDLSNLPEFDVIIESTGRGRVAFETIDRAGANGIVCLLSVSATGECDELDLGAINREVVLGNRVIFGSVNANRTHYDDAITALMKADRNWLRSLITRRVPLAEWATALDREHDGVKTVVLFSSEYDSD